MSRDAGRAWQRMAPLAERAWSGIGNAAVNIFSGINWGNAGAGALKAYEAAISALGKAWEWLGRVWEGAKPYMEGIGQSLSRTFGAMSGVYENIKGIAGGLLDLAGAVAKWLGFGNKANKFPEFLGNTLGFLGQLAALGLEGAANVLQIISGALRAILDLVNGNVPDWQSYFPKWLIDYVKWLYEGIKNISDAMHNLVGDTPNMTAASPESMAAINAKAAEGQKAMEALPDYNPNRTAAEFFSKNGGINSLPYPAAQNQKNEITNKVEIYDNRTKVTSFLNGKPAPASVNPGLAVGRN